MRIVSAAIVAASLTIGVHSQGPTLTDAQITEAIKSGESKKFNHLVSDCVAKAGLGQSMAASLAGGVQRDGAFTVTISGNAGRVAFMAAQAKRLYRKFSIDNVSEDLRAPTIVVSVDPRDPARGSNSISIAAPIEHVVLKSKVNPDVSLQPEKVNTEPVEWSNLMGGKVEGNRAVAFFDYRAVRELPVGDIDVVVVTPAGERRCKIGTKDRNKLFGAM